VLRYDIDDVDRLADSIDRLIWNTGQRGRTIPGER
jgi:hypothetical protein